MKSFVTSIAAGSLLAVLWPVAGAEFAVKQASSSAADPAMGAPRGGPGHLG